MAILPPQYAILTPVGTAPAAALGQSPVIDGGTRRVADRYDPGRYLLRVVVSAGAVPTPAFFAY